MGLTSLPSSVMQVGAAAQPLCRLGSPALYVHTQDKHWQQCLPGQAHRRHCQRCLRSLQHHSTALTDLHISHTQCWVEFRPELSLCS